MNIQKGQFWRHKKTGSVYYITGFCTLEATNKTAVLYIEEEADEGAEELPWARDQDEFLDGRFELLHVHPESEANDGYNK